MSIFRARYSAPTTKDMAVLMVLFNPCGSIRLVSNWLLTWNKLRATGIPVFGAELVYPWQQPSLAEEVKTLTVRTDSIMFHKEKLLERLERDIPPEFTKLCAIDCDVIFQRPDWYDAVSKALDEVPVAQPYSECHWMGPDLKTTLMKNPSAATQIGEIVAAHEAGMTDRLSGHPGFAMAMRRGLVRQFPWAVVGGGDAVFFRGVNGLVGEFANKKMRRLMEPAWKEWSASAKVEMMGVVEGGIWHLWHGPIKGRQYYDRYEKFVEALCSTDDGGAVKDVRDILVENADGVWSWREDVKKTLNAMMLRYFAGRDDDAVALT